nr:hypothetical protein [Caldilineaceae bacterium]
IDQLLATGGPWARIPVGLGVAGLLAGAATGVWAFYTTPRYVQDDYRPLIRQTVQQGSDRDTVLAVFPWQVGYWRAYAPVWGRGELHGPWPLLTPSTAWDESVRAALDRALVQGKLWFPAHLSLGGILEGKIEAYLRGVGLDTSGRAVVNFENRWYSQTTRLSGWSRASAPVVAGTPVDFSAVRLGGFGLGQTAVESANQVVAVDLAWAGFPTGDVRVSLRLQDAAGRVFAQRDYAPLGSWPPAGDVQPGVDRVGLLLPPGLPPGEYGLAVGVGPLGEEVLLPVNGQDTALGLAEIGRLAVAAPAQPLPALRLPIQRLLAGPENREGIDFLGISGFDPAATLLAGAELNLSLFAQAHRSPTADWELYFSVLDSQGGGVAGWEGWPLPANPAQS